MATLNYVFTDAALTSAFDDSSPLSVYASNGGTGDAVVYIGLSDAARKIQADSNPGVDAITVSIVDADSGTTAVDAADIKLATSSSGLDSATGGASLSLGTTINGGAANRAEVHIRWTNDTGSATYTDISLQLSAVVESDV